MRDYIKQFSKNQFSDHVKTKFFGWKPANKLVIHHTYRPTQATWKGERTMRALKRYYEQKGWSAAPHLFIADDGIWRMWDMRKDGIHAGRLNYRSIGIEVVGNYDGARWTGKTKRNALHAIRELCAKLRIPYDQIYFHRDVSAKTCPGTAITKKWLIEQLKSETEEKKQKTPTVQLPNVRELTAKLETLEQRLAVIQQKVDRETRNSAKISAKYEKLVTSLKNLINT